METVCREDERIRKVEYHQRTYGDLDREMR